jgi:hypothetical protein
MARASHLRIAMQTKTLTTISLDNLFAGIATADLAQVTGGYHDPVPSSDDTGTAGLDPAPSTSSTPKPSHKPSPVWVLL